MTTIRSKFGNARSVFERNDRDKPPSPPNSRRASTPFLSSPSAPPRVKHTSSFGKSVQRRITPNNNNEQTTEQQQQQQQSPKTTTIRRTFSSSSSSSKRQHQQPKQQPESTGESRGPHNLQKVPELVSADEELSSSTSSKPMNIALKARNFETKPTKLKLHHNNPFEEKKKATTDLPKYSDRKPRKAERELRKMVVEDEKPKGEKEHRDDDVKQQKADKPKGEQEQADNLLQQQKEEKPTGLQEHADDVIKQPSQVREEEASLQVLETTKGEKPAEMERAEDDLPSQSSTAQLRETSKLKKHEIDRNSHRKVNKNKVVDKASKAAIKLQAVFRGIRQRIIYAWMLEHKHKENALRQRLEEIKAETERELQSLRDGVESYKEELRSKLDQRRAKHKDKVEFIERNQQEVERLKQDNAQFRTRNENLRENCRKLRLKNLRLEKSNTSQEEYMDQIQGHHDRCKEDNERLLEVQASYRKKLDQLQTSLDTRTAYAVSENRIKRRFRNAVEEYVRMVEGSKDSKNIELLSNLFKMTNQAKKFDKTPDEPCPYEEPMGAGGDLDFEDSCSSWLHAPPRIGGGSNRLESVNNNDKPEQITKSSSILSDLASLPLPSGSSDDDSYVFEDSSIKSGSAKRPPVAHKKGQGSTSNSSNNHSSTNQSGTDRESGKQGRPQPPPLTSRKVAPPKARARNKGNDDGSSSESSESSDDEGNTQNGTTTTRRKPKVSHQQETQQQHMQESTSKVVAKGQNNINNKNNKSHGRLKPTKLPQLRPTAKKPLPSGEADTGGTPSSAKRETAESDDDHSEHSHSSASSSRSEDSSTGSDGSSSEDSSSDDSQKAFDRNYQASIAKAASKLGGGVRAQTPASNPPTAQSADADDESPGWSSGDSDSDSGDEFS
ncbi:hypothetical protein ACA910_008963 [Epithemia clementina (nom. ined.)]